MHNFYNEPIDDKEIRSNWRAIEKYNTSNGYYRYIPASDFVANTVTLPGATLGAVNHYVWMGFPDAANTQALYTFRRPERWINGVLKVRKMYYTGSTNGTTNIRTEQRLTGHAVGGLLTAASPSMSTGIYVVPGPATAGTLLEYSFANLNNLFIPMTSQTCLITLSIYMERNHVDDTYGGIFRLLGFDLEYIEKEKYQGEDYNKTVVY